MKKVWIGLLTLALCACSSMQTVSIRDLEGQDNPADIGRGDRVEVTTRDDEKFEFTVREINALGLGGTFGFIPYERIRQVRVRRPGNAGDDLEWLWVVLGAAAFIAIIANADSVSVCSPGPCPSPQP
jgi:hypothetical protein